MATSKNKTKPLAAALYARVSTNHGQDVHLQLDDLHQLAQQRSWEAQVYVDEGVSGSKSSRPALDRMMEAVRAGEVQVVAVWRFDRFARSTSHLVRALEEFQAVGVEFVSIRESIDTSTPMGKAMFTIVAAIAELERELIRERVIAGVRKAQRDGKHCGRPRRDVPVEAALALLDQGRSLRETAKLVRVDRSTLRDRLRELGHWPRVAVGQ